MTARSNTARPAAGARDPRLYQIACLAGLLLYGTTCLDFGVTPARVGLILSTVLLVQLGLGHARGLAFEPRSALISGLSLCLLLRTNSLVIVVATAMLTIASKLLFRLRGRHLFNPTNLGLVAMMLLTGQVWVSPGQWGNAAFFGFLMACLGGLVVNRASRSDVTLAFLAAYAGLLLARALWLGDPLAIPLHQLRSGALLLFAFFMISDPKTTPESRPGRILFAVLVALGAAYIQFRLFRTNGLLWSLALASPLVPVIDWLLPGQRYQWDAAALKGALDEDDEPASDPGPAVPGLAVPRTAPVGLLRLLRREG